MWHIGYVFTYPKGKLPISSPDKGIAPSLDGLIKQFLKDQVNDRMDEYCGSLEKRCCFALEVAEAMVQEIKSHRVGTRLSPYTDYPDGAMLFQGPENEIPYALLPMRKVFNSTFIAAEGIHRSKANRVIAENYTELIAFGRLFLGNPDLSKRFKLDAPLNKYNRSIFCISDPVVGCTDYPFLEEA
ncbi:12-oxophytodienoate reductase [Handroanthus impetiginosus]|uniref:12-oxophytodienoate reductase n=1 Tax=Handroanthus impetiginosus TaxID=429701 RepID=A0A2G9GWI7_9LAMI|nr:12-oxophytodienoate reductase [Handroanthus impetiginosus]